MSEPSWVQLGGASQTIVPVPPGVLAPFAGSAIPSGWLLCDGQAVSRTTYANLFAAIGTAYGTGDGSTTFNLPNLKGRVPVGVDAAQTEFDARGEQGGVKTHPLAAAEMPSHNHAVNSHSHGGATQDRNQGHVHGGTTDGESVDHAHGGIIIGYNTISRSTSGSGTNLVSGVTGTGGSAQAAAVSSGGRSAGHTHTFTSGGENQGHTHGINAEAPGTNWKGGSGGPQSDGPGAAHNNLQPYLAVDYIIKT